MLVLTSLRIDFVIALCVISLRRLQLLGLLSETNQSIFAVAHKPGLLARINRRTIELAGRQNLAEVDLLVGSLEPDRKRRVVVLMREHGHVDLRADLLGALLPAEEEQMALAALVTELAGDRQRVVAKLVLGVNVGACAQQQTLQVRARM